MSASLTIKDATGKIVLDLTSRITRLVIDYEVTTSDAALLPKQVIKVGPKTERNTMWFLTRYAKTAWSNRPNVEGGPYPSFAVYLADKAEIQAAGYNASWTNEVLPKMDNDSVYIIIEDTRRSVQAGYQNKVTVDVGRF